MMEERFECTGAKCWRNSLIATRQFCGGGGGNIRRNLKSRGVILASWARLRSGKCSFGGEIKLFGGVILLRRCEKL